MTIENINEKILEYSNNIEPITGKMIPIFTPQLNIFKIVNQLKK